MPFFEIIKSSTSIMYAIVAIAYFCFIISIKFRFRENHRAEDEKFLFRSLFLFSIFLIAFETYYLVNFLSYDHLYYTDIANYIFLFISISIAKIISSRVDNINDTMREIVKKKEACTYNLVKLWIINSSLIIFPVIHLSSAEKIDFFFLGIYFFFALTVLLHEFIERIIPIRFLYLEHIPGKVIKNENLKYLFLNRRLFWFRELSGNITKSTFSCWIALVIIMLIFIKIEPASLCYEGKPLVDIKGLASLKRDSFLDISSAFYIVASEMFFSNSGIYPCHPLSKVVFFSMHVYGLFLYGIFFAIGIQAFGFRESKKEPVDLVQKNIPN